MDPSKPAPPHTSPLGMWSTKLSLRVIQFTLSIAMIGLVGSVMSAGFWALGTLICAAPPTIVSAVWALSEGICIFARGGHRGIHPGACVAVDLLLWLTFIGSTVALWFLGIATAIASGTLDGLANYNRDPYEWSDNSVSDTMDGLVAKGQALVGLGATLV